MLHFLMMTMKASPIYRQIPASSTSSCSSSSSSKCLFSPSTPTSVNLNLFPASSSAATNSIQRRSCHHQLNRKPRAVEQLSAAVTSDPVQGEVTWQIIVGTLAGVTPFVVAGIEFSKRIVAQQNCGGCGGSGLVLRDNKYYFRCPQCGGFLPWQSWKRFFSG